MKIPVKFGLTWANGCLERLWHYTAKFHPRGDIGSSPDWAIADACGWPGDDCDALVDALVASRWLDRNATYRLIVHDWQEHADESVKKSLKYKGLSFCFPENSATVPGPSQPAFPKPLPKPLPEADAGKVRVFPSPEDAFEKLYKRHPKKAERGIAENYYAQSLASGEDPAEIDRVHKLYCESEWDGMESRFVPKLGQWLLDHGWKYPPKARDSPKPTSEAHLPYVDPFKHLIAKTQPNAEN